MTSSTLSGDRRWASSRRSGMTVLGKVAVPKPINLPSQRLENHGLDPNVEIVPKGTLSWGSKSSSSSNAWGSSTLSPNTDGGSGSPSHLSARPSSGGSGTRPSTAGSDRAHEPANAWGSNSRPSSASGALASSQSSLASLRPRSAETRPGSSQLSRFAETIPENSGAWGASGTAEKLGMTSSKNDGFSLASGDFPTLGSEKDSTGKNAELQDHGSQGRPGSSSGVAPMKERTGPSTVVDVSANANPKSGSANSWRRDNPPYSEDGVRPSMEKWHADPQGPHPPYPNTGIPPQHYDAWHGPPINNHPGGVWYRGPPGGPPYGPPPGAFPMEPFPYYRPQIPGNALGNPQPVPPPGAGPRGPHPKNGDMYRGPMPDAFVRPGMPIRPPFYPGPVAYEGYYGPPMGYCNSNERDIPFMGMPAGPSPHNRYPGQNAPDHGGSHARPSGYGPPGKALAAEHLESGHPHDVRGPYKVLLKQHDGWEGKDEENRWEDNATATVEKGDRRRTSSWENDWKADQRKEEEVRIRRDQSPGQIIDHHGGDSILGKVKSSDAVDNAKAYDDISAKRVEYSEVPATTKDSNLIQQIEGLNAKARASDGRLESVSVYNREEQKNKSQVVNAKAKHFANEVATGSRAAFTDKMPASGMSEPTSNEVGFSAADKSLDVPAGGAGVNRRSTHGMHTRPDHHRGRGRFNLQDADGWRKRPPYTDSSNVKPATDSENPSNVNMQDHMSLEASEKSVLLSYPQARDEGESMQPVFDPSDSQAKRAMMRELAKQRVKQRQKEEEERARDQKAKALAKLEELNRRTQMAEGLTQKLESVPDSATQSKQEECQTLAEESILTSRSEVTSLAPVSNPIIDADVGQSSTGGLEKPTVFNNQQPLVSTKNVHKATTDMCEQSLPVQQRVNSPDASINNHPQVSDGSTSKQKRVGYKKRDNNSMDKNSSEKPISTSTIELPKHTDAAVDVAPSAETVVKENVSSPEFISAQNVVNEPSVQQRRKNNRSGKSKHKMEEASSIAPLPSGISKDTNLSSTSVEGSKPKSSEIESDPRPVQSLTDSKDGNRSSEQDSAPNEEVHGRMNNQWKSQHSRRMPRNAQTHRSAVHSNDAVVWAPVRPHNKVEVIEEESHKPVVEAVAPQVKNDPQVQSNTRSKRAEMERYIPKPVAKEMAQQVISQQPVALSENQYAAEETGGRADSGSHGVECSQPVGFAVGKVENSTESRNDGRQSRQGRGHGSWRQRASSEATFQGLQDGQYSNQGKNTRKMTEHNQQQKPDLSLVKEQQPKYDEWNTSDGWNMPEAPDSSAPPVVPVVRDQGVTGRGKRQAFKGHKGGGSNHDFDHKKINNGEAEKASTQSPVHEMAQSDLPATPKENRVGDRSTSQWQPKSSAINNRGTRPDNDQNAGPEIGRANKKDTAQGKVSLPSQPEKETTGSVTQPLKDQYIPDKRNVEEAHNAGHYESKRERKVGSLKGRPQSPNQGLDLPMEAPPSNVDNRNEQRTTSGLRKNGNQHNRFGRGHESRGEWGSSGQEIRQQHNPPANRDRQRHNNSHYEYQPVGPQNNSRPNNPEGPKDGTHTGGRFRDRGQSHSRRGGGNFHGRQSGAVRVDGGYE